MFGAKTKKIADLEQGTQGLESQLQQAQAHLAHIGGLEHWQVRQQVDQLRAELRDLGAAQLAERQRHAAELEQQRAAHAERLAEIEAQIERTQQELVPFTDELVFQRAGVFRYQHPLENAEAYRRELDRIGEAIQKLGSMLEVRISNRYRGLRMRELELTADYLQKKQE